MKEIVLIGLLSSLAFSGVEGIRSRKVCGEAHIPPNPSLSPKMYSYKISLAIAFAFFFVLYRDLDTQGCSVAKARARLLVP